MPPSERRRHPRIRGPFGGVVEDAAGRRTVRIIDLSIRGCFIDDGAKPALDERLRLTIHLPQTASATVDGRVVYIDSVKGFGIEFVDVAPATQQTLAAVIRRFTT